jgi:hypothetical protein
MVTRTVLTGVIGLLFPVLELTHDRWNSREPAEETPHVQIRVRNAPGVLRIVKGP